MKPEDLKTPFRFSERRVLLEGRMFYVPDHLECYKEYCLPPFKELFGNPNPVFVEYCAGHGHWVVERALASPHQNWIAVERRFDRVRRIWAKRENCKIENLLIVCGEAHCVTEHYFYDASLAGVYINFPDPWPKRRHAKHRLIDNKFLNQLRRSCQIDAPFVFVTDDRGYTERFIDQMGQIEGFVPTFPLPHYIMDWTGYGDSYFDTLWRQRGRSIHYVQYRRNQSPCF